MASLFGISTTAGPTRRDGRGTLDQLRRGCVDHGSTNTLGQAKALVEAPATPVGGRVRLVARASENSERE